MKKIKYVQVGTNLVISPDKILNISYEATQVSITYIEPMPTLPNARKEVTITASSHDIFIVYENIEVK